MQEREVRNIQMAGLFVVIGVLWGLRNGAAQAPYGVARRHQSRKAVPSHSRASRAYHAHRTAINKYPTPVTYYRTRTRTEGHKGKDWSTSGQAEEQIWSLKGTRINGGLNSKDLELDNSVTWTLLMIPYNLHGALTYHYEQKAGLNEYITTEYHKSGGKRRSFVDGGLRNANLL